jgi:hypothetical protein
MENGTHRGKGGATDQSLHGRMRLGTACREETLRVKNVSIMSSRGRKLCLWAEETCVVPTEKFTHVVLVNENIVYIRKIMNSVHMEYIIVFVR